MNRLEPVLDPWVATKLDGGALQRGAGASASGSRGREWPGSDVFYDLLKGARENAGIKHWPHDSVATSWMRGPQRASQVLIFPTNRCCTVVCCRSSKATPALGSAITIRDTLLTKSVAMEQSIMLNGATPRTAIAYSDLCTRSPSN